MKLSEEVYKITWDVSYNSLFTEDQLRSVLKDPVANPVLKEAAKAKLAEIETERNRIDFAALPSGTQVERDARTFAKRYDFWFETSSYDDAEMAEMHDAAPFTVVWQPKTLLDHLHDAGFSDVDIRYFANDPTGSLGRLCLAALSEVGDR